MGNSVFASSVWRWYGRTTQMQKWPVLFLVTAINKSDCSLIILQSMVVRWMRFQRSPFRSSNAVESLWQITPWTVQSYQASALLRALLWAPWQHGSSTSWAHWGKRAWLFAFPFFPNLFMLQQFCLSFLEELLDKHKGLWKSRSSFNAIRCPRSSSKN